MKYEFLFGPVPSRRLNISLGVDIIPHKVCNLNCIYCESGGTTIHTNERKEYLPFKKIISELDHYLSEKPKLDYITFSGAGEPTLNSRLGDIILYLKSNFPHYKIALITNGLLLSDPNLRKEIQQVDVILPSLDSVSEEIFQKINRPVNNLSVFEVTEGLIKLRNEFKGEIWLEIFIAAGINDDLESLKQLKETIKKINPDKIQLNSLDRPGTEDWTNPSTISRLEEIKHLFHPLQNVEIVSRAGTQKHIESLDDDITDIILSTIKRRPCNFQDLANIVNVEDKELSGYLEFLLKENRIESYSQPEGLFYRVPR